MDASTPNRLHDLTASDLLPIVQQAIGEPAEEIPEWQMQKLSGGAGEHIGFTLGLWRITGTARVQRRELPWSVVLKMAGPSAIETHNEPDSPEYWKREVLAFQSDALDHLPGELVAVRCYGVDELADGTYRIWLEDVHEMEADWTMEHHRLVARHLGKFNGAYLAGMPLPEPAPWMLPGHLQYRVERNPPDKELLFQFSETDLGRWLPKQSVERMVDLWAQRAQLLDAFERLPVCFCHHDAIRRNLMLRENGDGELETVAVDWQKLGPGKVGQEIGVTTAVNLIFLDVSGAHARELDDAVFAGYCAGLRDAGWLGDVRLARFGYAITAGLEFGVAFSIAIAKGQQQDGGARGAAILGRPIEHIVEEYATMHPFLLDLGDEALELMPVVSSSVPPT